MAQLVANCPRCGASKITFDLVYEHPASDDPYFEVYEAFCICRHCHLSTVFRLRNNNPSVQLANLVNNEGAVNHLVDIAGYISLKDSAGAAPPEHLPENVEKAFKEGATCFAVGCWNAAGSMFRLCLDLATKELLPPEGQEGGPDAPTRQWLAKRLNWLFDERILPDALRDLSAGIKDDGNDGAHDGTLTKEDASDLLDFTFILLERVFTEPKNIELARIRRAERRNQAQQQEE